MTENKIIAKEKSAHDNIMQLLSSRTIHWFLFVIIGIAIYGFTLSYPFVFDDCLYVLNNPLLKNSNAFNDILNLDIYFAKYLTQLRSPDIAFSFVLRPVSYFTFYLNFLLGGQVPDGFRAFNIAVHIANAIMLYEMLRFILLQRLKETESTISITLPLFSALIFLVHPLQTESVTYILQRFCSLGTFFYLGTMLLYLRSSISKYVAVRVVAYISSILLLILGMLAKEIVELTRSAGT